MVLTVPEGCGEGLLNAIRSEAFNSQKVLRPIGFKIGNCSNVIDTPECVIEDMTSFISGVCKGVYRFGGNEDCLVSNYSFTGELYLESIAAEVGAECLHDFAVLHTLPGSKSIEVSVVFRNCKGTYTSHDNTQFMKSKGLEGYVSVNSRHSNVETFAVKKMIGSDDKDRFEVEITTVDGSSPNSVLKNAIDSMGSKLEIIRSFI